MNTVSRTLFGATLLAAAAACASGSGGAEGASGDAISAAGTREGVPRWSGNLTPTTQRTGVLAPPGQSRAFGTVEITPAPSGPDRVRVRITLSAPAENRTLSWAVLPGRCGTPQTPLIALDLFPPLEIGANGRGQTDVIVPMAFPGDGTYQLAVYWNRSAGVGDIMTCANLKRS